MANVSYGAGREGMRAFRQAGASRGETLDVQLLGSAAGKAVEAAPLKAMASPGLDALPDIAWQGGAGWEAWDAEPDREYGYLPNATTLASVPAKRANETALVPNAGADNTKPAHAINGDQRATSLRSHLAWQEEHVDDDDGIYSPVLKVTRRASANLER